MATNDIAEKATMRQRAPSCIIQFRPYYQFRPSYRYKGEYGFDWIRKGNNNNNEIENELIITANGDAFNNIACNKLLGKYINTDCIKNSTCEYKDTCTDLAKNPEKVCQDINSWSWKTDKNNTDELFQKDEDSPSSGAMFRELDNCFEQVTIQDFIDYDYQVPVLTLLPEDNEIKLSMRIFIKNSKIKEKLLWDYDTDIFSLEPPKDLSLEPAADNSWQNKELKLKCNKEFSSDKYIKVYYYKDKENPKVLCGKLRILANDDSHRTTLNVVLVEVEVDIGNAPEPGIGAFDSTNLTSLENILKQGYVFIKKENGKPIEKELDLAEWRDKFINSFVDISTTGRTIKKDKSSRNNLVRFLNDKFNSLYGNYENYFRVYSINEEGGDNGFAILEEETCVVFNGHNAATIAHELLHALKLPHTFNAKETVKDSKFAEEIITYKAKQTENIMDYSHWDNKNRISTFYWQWKIINPNISKK